MPWASPKTPHIIRVRPVTLVQLDDDAETGEHRFEVVSRDEEHGYVLHVRGEVDPAMLPAIDRIGAEWLLQSIANCVHETYRIRRQHARQ